VRILLGCDCGSFFQGYGGIVDRFHKGEIAVQEMVGVRRFAERLAGSVFHSLPQPAREFLSTLSFAAITWFDERGKIWTTPVTGSPGFLRATDESTIAIDLLNCAAPLFADQQLKNAPAALVCMDFAGRRRMRVNGYVSSGNTLLFRAVEVYANCPKYIQRRTPDRALEPIDIESRSVMKALLDEKSQKLINSCDTFFIGSYAVAGGADASHRGGAPGFVKADENSVRWVDYPGNNMFNTLGNIESNRESALLFLNFQTREGLALTGSIESFSPSSAGRAAEEETVFKVQSANYMPRALAQSWNEQAS